MGEVIVSVDPGAKLAGVAIFNDELVTAYLVKGNNALDTARSVWGSLAIYNAAGLHLVIEKPQVYVQSKQKGDANDLITLAIMVGALASHFDFDVTLYLPRQWKGQVPKDIMIERIKTKLSKDELSRIELPRVQSLHHNIWDSVGIGLHHQKRLHMGRK